MKNMEIFHLKIIVIIGRKNRSILHGRVLIMEKFESFTVKLLLGYF